MALAALSNVEGDVKLIEKCTATSKIHGMPLDCIAENVQSSDCQDIQKFLNWCQAKLNP